MSCKHSVLVAALTVLFSSSLGAQPADPTGHWEGGITAGDVDIAFTLDVHYDGGRLTGTISLPSEKLVGIPLQSVSVDGKVVAFHARRDQMFSGELSDDGTWIVGNLDIQGMRPGFTLKRAGATVIAPAITSARISDDLAGNWEAAIAADGQSMRVTLRLANHANGTATGILVNDANGGLQLPVTIVQKGRQVTLTLVGPQGSFEGTVDANGAELSGTWTDGTRRLPIAFRREGAAR